MRPEFPQGRDGRSFFQVRSLEGRNENDRKSVLTIEYSYICILQAIFLDFVKRMFVKENVVEKEMG